MRITGYRPANTWLERQLDNRWKRWLSWCCTGGLLVAGALASCIAPHQAVVRMRYETAQVSSEVERLEREQRQLLLERERLTSLPSLAAHARDMGLEPVPLERVAYLTPEGSLAFAAAEKGTSRAGPAGERSAR